MKWLILTLISFHSVLFAQSTLGTGIQTGVDGIGLYSGLDFIYIKNKNSLGLGIKQYIIQYAFVRNLPGIYAKGTHEIQVSENFSLNPTLSAIYYQNRVAAFKSKSVQLNFYTAFNWRKGQFNLNVGPLIGINFQHTENLDWNEKYNFYYPNFGVQLGVDYKFK